MVIMKRIIILGSTGSIGEQGARCGAAKHPR